MKKKKLKSRHINLTKKIEISEYSYIVGVKATARFYKISASSIYRWRNDPKLKNQIKHEEKQPLYKSFLTHKNDAQIKIFKEEAILKSPFKLDLNPKSDKEKIDKNVKENETPSFSQIKETLNTIFIYILAAIVIYIFLFLTLNSGGYDINMPRGRR